MEKKQEVVPNYVFVSPYALQNNKAVEFVAKHGSLFLATNFLIHMILSQFNTENNFWFLFLPQFIYFSCVYIFIRNSNNKTFQLTQIFIMFILLLPTSRYLIRIVPSQPCGFLLFSFMVIYVFVLHIVCREHYIKDLSTPKSVLILNIVDFCFLLFFNTCSLSTTLLTVLLDTLYPQFRTIRDYNVPAENLLVSAVFVFVVGVIAMLALFNNVNSANRTKMIPDWGVIEIDSNGRAWCSLTNWWMCFVLRKRRSTSSVIPEESNELSLEEDFEIIDQSSFH